MKNYISTAILLTSLLVISIFTSAQNNQTNTQTWEKVDQLIEKDLPESALKAIDSISRIAEATNNQQEQIKVRLYRYRIQTEKEPNTSPAVLKDFEQFAEAFEPSAIKQLLFCMAAEMYHNYYQSKHYEIDSRTNVAGLLPQNIETWSKNHYQQKVKSLIDEAWKEHQISQQTDISSLQKLFVFQSERKEDINITPTLFDYIAYKRIEVAEAWKDEKTIQETYKELIQFRKKQGDSNLSVLAEINYLDYLYGQSDSQTFIQKADSLEQVYQQDPAVVEIMAQKAKHYLHNTEIPQHKKLAHAICKKGIETYPDYTRIGLLHNIIVQIEQQSLFIESAGDAAPSGELKLNIRTTNIPAIILEIHRLKTTSEDFARYDLNKEIDSDKEPFDKSLIETITINLPLNENFEAVDTTFLLPTHDYGIYEYIAYPAGLREKDKMTKAYFTVTDLTFIKRAVSEDKNAYYVLNRITGKQEKQVEITSFEYKWTDNQYEMTLTATGKTNSKGYVELPRLKSYGNEIIVLKKKDDRYFSTMSYSPYFSKFKPTETIQQRVNIFTDRAIYRPGQTVYFKAIAYESGKDKQEVIVGKNIRIELLNTNRKSISKLHLTTNEFGSVSGTFILPSTGLNGNFQILIDNKQFHNILIEEYKRPTFEVTVTQPAAEISFGETVTLKGEVKAFASYSLPDTKVKYVINRYVHPFWRWFPPNRIEAMIASGETTTDAKGKFSIQFTPEIDKSIRENRVKQAYRYTITIDATDSKGESQQTIAHLSVSEQSLFIMADVPELLNKQDTARLKVSTQNIAGEKIHKSIRYQLFSLKETTDYRENLKSDTAFTTDKLMTEGTFDTQSAHLALQLNKYPSGRYKLIFTTDDKHGNPVESEHIFILYDKKDKRPPVKTYVWLPETQFESLPGEKINIHFGTSVKCAHVLMEVKYGNELISSKWIRMNNNIRTFSIPFAAKHRGGITVDFTFVRDEQVFQETVRITEKIIEKKLTPKLTVFRDKLLPGEAATWTVNIPEAAAKGKIAELLAGMYDASLDELKPHQWEFNPVYRRAFPGSYSWNSYQKQTHTKPMYVTQKQNNTPEFYMPSLNWYGLNLNIDEILTFSSMTGTGVIRKTAITGSITALRNTEVVITEDAVITSSESRSYVSDTQTQPPRIRSNFNETVFFYPHLQGDKSGNYQFSFTMPESLTRWNLKMLAHTKDLYFGQAEAQLITQQDLMVQLNMPRFVRQSDKLTLQASLVNLSDKALKANVKLTFIDPTTDQPVLLNDTNMVAVDVPADGKPLTLSWNVSGFDQYEWLICKVVADADNFSDGEQRYLAILPDKVLVTESYPVFIGNEATKEFKFDSIQSIINKVDTRQLTFEFSANPVWYAIQALPALAEPKNENAVDYFIAWYVNALAGNILADNPRIKTIFEQIKQTEPGSIQSALNKNQELKNILLEETPWLTEAKNETEQQQRIALLFDLNQQEQLKSRYLDKLSTLQLPNGAFSWFDGMGESRWVTQFIAEGLLKAREFTDINIINRMLGPAMNYLEGQITKDYLQVKKQVKDYEKKMNINSLQLHFLSLRTKINAPEISADSKEAMVFYIKETEQYYNKFGLYDKALAAMILHHANKPVAVDAIIKSLKENSLRTTDKGMYWSKNTAGYRWNERPISVQVKLMEAFNLVPGNETELALMKTWLLRQKQTQQWESPVASVNAIYALTGIGNNLLNNKQSFSITAGKKTFDTNQGIPGTDYIKQTLAKEDIKEGITINRVVNQPETASPAWGAMYWQYYQDMDKVRSSGSALQVEKQLFVERIVDNRKTLFPINGQNVNATMQSIQMGDKVIARMVVTTDRDLEFVVLKDNRAANLEPVNQLSGCSWKEGVVYYRTVKDASTQYFFSHLPKGTYVFEDEYFVNATGNFSGGTASIQCLYAPEFVGVGKGERVEIR
ncbi:MAG: alpha-2-macroglobulin family protein [Paludibacter sp.]|nr:alpha-2-macroglobulin family protein [Paludibacter sp.]